MSKENKVPDKALESYLQSLINKVYKVLPMKEEGCETLDAYLLSLENELIGCYKLWGVLENEPQFLAVINVVKYLATEEYDVVVCKREVFKTIHLIESINKKYFAKEG